MFSTAYGNVGSSIYYALGVTALYAGGMTPVTFATNKLVLAVPAANPANITSVYDLRRTGIKLIICTPTVPIGSYTRKVLSHMGLTSAAMAM